MLIQEQLQQKKDFSNIEALIADYLLLQQEQIAEQSARHIATQVFTAPSTVVRLCQKLGYMGFNDFKKAYVNELHYIKSHFNDVDPNYPFDYQDQGIAIAYKMQHLYKEVMEDILNLMDQQALKNIIKCLIEAEIIYICSSGIQGDIAYSFRDKMLRIGKNVIIEEKMDEAFYMASYATSKHVFIMISYSGETDMLLRVAKKLNKRKIERVAITSYKENSLTKLCSHVLYVSTREKLIDNLGNFGMDFSTLFLLDVLYANIFNENNRMNFDNRIQTSHEFQKFRNSSNPILHDEKE